jgi:hypothetical protein
MATYGRACVDMLGTAPYLSQRRAHSSKRRALLRAEGSYP